MMPEPVQGFGTRFLSLLEECTDPSRLQYGCLYFQRGGLLTYRIVNGIVVATVRSSFAPGGDASHCQVCLKLLHIAPADWKKIIAQVRCRADLVIKLLWHEVPEDLDSLFRAYGWHLFPQSVIEMVTTCSCFERRLLPCPHIAAVFYHLAADLDRDPFLLFELRGITRDRLCSELARSPLGSTLATSGKMEERPADPAEAYYIRPLKQDKQQLLSYKAFWIGGVPLPSLPLPATSPGVQEWLMKQQGDSPAFWHEACSFLELMDALYTYVQKSNALET